MKTLVMMDGIEVRAIAEKKSQKSQVSDQPNEKQHPQAWLA